MCDETGGGPPIAEALAGARRRGARGAVGDRRSDPRAASPQAELAALRRMKDVMAVGLGPRILRADTAALAALACWQALVGDWRQPTPRLASDYRTSRGYRLSACARPCRYGRGEVRTS